MSKIFTKEEILKLNSLLDETLQQADKEQLIACVKILGTAVASLKVKFNANEESVPEIFKDLVAKVQDNEFSEELGKIMSKTVVECATAMAVTRPEQSNE
ncbi:MAG: hypothetical protein HQL46_01850 [Gammaproteobacteria bacterium]|nr:hypothetical protein [Gammaproteobacteria bacterium]